MFQSVKTNVKQQLFVEMSPWYFSIVFDFCCLREIFKHLRNITAGNFFLSLMVWRKNYNLFLSTYRYISMLINIIHIIATCPNSVALRTWLQNLKKLNLLDLLVVFLSYFYQTNSETTKTNLYCLRLSYVFTTTLICAWALVLV